MRNKQLIILLIAITLSPTSAQIPLPEFSKREINIAMADGTHLATDIYLPALEGKVPTVIVRTPYGKDGAQGAAKEFASIGLAVIVQDCRGKYRSEGKFYPFRDERADGLTTLQWIRDQPWSNGKVGGWGASYVGYTQWAISDSLDVFSPDLTMGDIYNLMYPDGLFSLQTGFNFGFAMPSKKLDPTPPEKLAAAMHILPLSVADDSTIQDIPYINDWLRHEKKDDYWHRMNHRGVKKAPVISTGGWYDYFVRGQIEDFQALSTSDKLDNRLIIGPWSHEPQPDDKRYGGRDKTGNRSDLIRDHIINHLKDQGRTAFPAPFKDQKYNLFIMERNEYFGSDVWPPRETKMVPYYLGPEKYLSPGIHTRNGSLQYLYDPRNPYPSVRGPKLGAVEQNSNIDRKDQVVFETGPLEEPLVLLGPLSATLWLSSDAPCTDFIVCVQDVSPDGKIFNIQEGAAKVAFQSGKPEKKEISVWATGYQLGKGHKLRVAITSSWFPRYNRSLNTCKPIFSATEPVTARQRVHYGPATPSAINLPVLQIPAVTESSADRNHLREIKKEISYGPHERNVLDLYLADADAATPLVVFIHGGGFRRGSKEMLSKVMLEHCLQRGVSVAAINYRLTDSGPFPMQHMDAARAIQFLRHHAAEWNLDPTRIAATGESAGAGISLWLGFHDDLANPAAKDPVLRESTRLTCMALQGAQHTYDPHWIKEHIGGNAHIHPALALFYGVPTEAWHLPKALKVFERSAAITYLTRDDPPVWAIYNEPDADVAADAEVGVGIHHPRFGRALKTAMDEAGIPCILKHADDYETAESKKHRQPFTWPEDALMPDLVDFIITEFEKGK